MACVSENKSESTTGLMPWKPYISVKTSGDVYNAKVYVEGDVENVTIKSDNVIGRVLICSKSEAVFPLNKSANVSQLNTKRDVYDYIVTSTGKVDEVTLASGGDMYMVSVLAKGLVKKVTIQAQDGVTSVRAEMVGNLGTAVLDAGGDVVLCNIKCDGVIKDTLTYERQEDHYIGDPEHKTMVKIISQTGDISDVHIDTKGDIDLAVMSAGGEIHHSQL